MDQATFAPGAFFWFFSIGAVTVVMAGGISRRPAPVARPVPAADVDEDSDPGAEGASAPEDPDESDPDESDPEWPGETAEVESEPDTDIDPEPEPTPAPPPPPVKPAPEVEDVEDLMFVDADIETDGAG